MRAQVFGRRLRMRGLVVVFSGFALGLSCFVVGGTNAAQATVTKLATFKVPGRYTWTVPTGVTKITFTIYGASGGPTENPGPNIVAIGGFGGEAKGTFAVKPGMTFQIFVGGAGFPNNGKFGGAAGDWGYGGSGGDAPDGYLGGGGGGASSSVAIGGKENPCASDTTCNVFDRIIVGGGGGGASQNTDGASGGGLSGGSTAGGPGGGQDGLVVDCSSDTFGCFGAGGRGGTTSIGAGGGGGDGWFGGDGGSYNTGEATGGGGGSGYISGLALSGSFPGGTRGGDGLVIITTP